MSFNTKFAIAIGAIWAILYFIYGWNHADRGKSRFLSALKASFVAFAVMALFTRACTVIMPESFGDKQNCESLPGIYGC